LGTSKPSVELFEAMANRVERRLISTSIFLTQVGKLELVNSVLSSLPIYFMTTLKIPVSVLQQIDKYRRHGLWNGSTANAKKTPRVTRPKSKGGLGITKLRTHNDALLMKALHKFFNRLNIPWVKLLWEFYYGNGKLPGSRKEGSSWWRNIVKLVDQFKGFACPQIKNGSAVLAWEDLWQGGVILKEAFSELYSFTKHKQISIQKALQGNLADLFHIPLSEQAYSQFLQVQTIFQSISQQDENDKWSYIWGPVSSHHQKFTKE
jgi:hypothetical protein